MQFRSPCDWGQSGFELGRTIYQKIVKLYIAKIYQQA